ncbi:MAG TPA: hypothetical protein VI933_02535 [archaeon]|nr:hypothetical protein [archaeon]
MLNQKMVLILLGIVLIAGCTAQAPQATTTSTAPTASSQAAVTEIGVGIESGATAATAKSTGTASQVSMNMFAIVSVTRAS